MSSPDSKVTVEQILARKIGGQSNMHVRWVSAKKSAAKEIDAKVISKLLNKNLGGAWDAYHQIVEGAKEVKRFFPTLDDRTLGPVKKAKAKLDQIMKDYAKICKQEAGKAGLTAKQKSAWNQLAGLLEGWQGESDLWLKELNA